MKVGPMRPVGFAACKKVVMAAVNAAVAGGRIRLSAADWAAGWKAIKK